MLLWRVVCSFGPTPQPKKVTNQLQAIGHLCAIVLPLLPALSLLWLAVSVSMWGNLFALTRVFFVLVHEGWVGLALKCILMCSELISPPFSLFPQVHLHHYTAVLSRFTILQLSCLLVLCLRPTGLPWLYLVVCYLDYLNSCCKPFSYFISRVPCIAGSPCTCGEVPSLLVCKWTHRYTHYWLHRLLWGVLCCTEGE